MDAYWSFSLSVQQSVKTVKVHWKNEIKFRKNIIYKILKSISKLQSLATKCMNKRAQNERTGYAFALRNKEKKFSNHPQCAKKHKEKAEKREAK